MSRSAKVKVKNRWRGRRVVRRPAEAAVNEGGGDRSGVHVWLVLMKAHRSLVRHAERSIVSLDMCISDFGVLEVLLHKGSHSVSEIGRRVELTSGSITTPSIGSSSVVWWPGRRTPATDARLWSISPPMGRR
jgi:hypothetical protein